MPELPPTRVDPVRETYFGTTVEDPYRWMEDLESEETQAWMRAQADYARAHLDALPHRAELGARVRELSAAVPRIMHMIMRGDRVFYLRQDPGEQVPRLMVREGEEERLVVDPGEAMVDWFTPSHDGERVAYGSSRPGSESSELRIVRTSDGRDFGVVISRVFWGHVTWMPDNETLLFPRFPVGEGQERFLRPVLTRYRVGEPVEATEDLLAMGMRDEVPLTPSNGMSVVVRRGCEWAVLEISHGVAQEHSFYVVPVASLLGAPEDIPWRKVCGPEDQIVHCALTREHLYLVSCLDAPCGRVLRVPLAAPDLAGAEEVVPERRAVLGAVFSVGGRLCILARWGGVSSFEQLSADGVRPTPLPFDGSVIGVAGDPDRTRILLKLTGWTRSPVLYWMDLESGETWEADWVPTHPADFSEIVVSEVEVPTTGGETVPLSILHRRGLERDGARPAVVHAYGAYGMSLNAHCDPLILPLLERGGIYAVAHVRGGGEKGKDWHRFGHLLHKRNTIDDVIACAEHLVAEGWTAPAHLAVEGGSAGGIAAGGAVVVRPDLWGAALMLVPTLNLLRKEFTPVGPANAVEFGTLETDEGFRALQIGDICYQVRKGTAYPAILVTVGARDPRVLPWEGMKGVAYFQAATSSDAPVLLRVDYEGGHGVAETEQTREQQAVDKTAFLLHHLVG